MYYITGIKKGFSMNKETKKQIIEILKYNTKRQYFGEWVPAEIHDKYHSSRKYPESSLTVYTGQISMNDICDALWNEMSYNPVRFGTKNPFIFNGVKDLLVFALKYADEKYKTKNKLFFDIATLLKSKIYELDSLDPMFSATGHTQGTAFPMNDTIRCEITPMYYILSNLAQSIHLIATQNLKDFNSSKQHRTEIIRVVTARHPNLIRPMKNVNYTEMEKRRNFLSMLNMALVNKQMQIDSTNVSIESLRELEQPGDTTALKMQLRQQKQQFADIENIYARHESEYAKLFMEWKNKHRIR